MAAASAHATEFKGNWSITDLQTSDPGLVVQTTASSGTFDIPDGLLTPSSPSTYVDLFKIYTTEGSVESDDQQGGQTISVTFDFSLPALGSTTISGDTFGSKTFFGLIQNGVVTWDNGGVGDFTWGNGGDLTITLNGGTFDTGLAGLHGGVNKGLDVQAKFDWLSDPVGVPEPATWALMIGGFGLAGVALRRRRAATVA
ncbi:MAG: PEP-CTERM sorting domain-containing protein [Proteobacteria bacterium]|nr:PEP-CTERM sorting domain-containing protein [Pseudomonadota bacterium]